MSWLFPWKCKRSHITKIEEEVFRKQRKLINDTGQSTRRMMEKISALLSCNLIGQSLESLLDFLIGNYEASKRERDDWKDLALSRDRQITEMNAIIKSLMEQLHEAKVEADKACNCPPDYVCPVCINHKLNAGGVEIIN